MRIKLVPVGLFAGAMLVAGSAFGDQIMIVVTNDSHDSSNVSVYDLFANGKRDVNNGNPFALAAGASTGPIGINANLDGTGTIEWDCNPGGSLSNVTVHADDPPVKACR
jgi:hypothetical protein